jgi:hypothetical protein
MSDGVRSWIVGLIAVVSAAILGQLSLGERVADMDAFYHLGHAALYAKAPFDTRLPWAAFSVIGDQGGDLWWGFHLLLAPVAGLVALPRGFAVAGGALTVVFLGSFLYLFRAHHVPAAWAWTLFLFLAVPNALYRYLMVRPHMLSIPAGLLLASALARGRWRLAGGAAAFLVWVHISFFWLVPLILGAFAISSLVDARRLGRPVRESIPQLAPAFAYPIAGMLLGWLARPHPIATARLVDVQVFQLLRERQADLPLAFGGDLTPLPLDALGTSSWLVWIPWIVALGLTGWALGPRPGEGAEGEAADRLMLGAVAIVSLALFGLMLAVAGRAMTEWVAFALPTIALASRTISADKLRRGAIGLWALVTLLAAPWLLSWHRLNARLNAVPDRMLQEAALWVEARSDPGDVVFHARWDEFGPLFAWNRTNYYLGGMDPIFQYAHDARLYWEFAYLSAGMATARSCGSFPCDGEAVDTYDVIAGDYGARWVLVEPSRNPDLFDFLRADPRFDLGLVSREAAVFEVLR